jgi:hypothetical protein
MKDCKAFRLEGRSKILFGEIMIIFVENLMESTAKADRTNI